jgi:signal transduction histidine kinase
MTRRLLVTYLTITALAIAALAVPLGLSNARRERDRLYFDIERDAIVVAALVEDALEERAAPDVDGVLAEYRERTTGRIVVVDRDGISVADSDGPDAAPRDYSTRPEIRTALEGQRATGTRRSATLDEDLVFVAIPVTSGGVVHGAVRITFPTAARDARVRDVWVQLAMLAAVVLALVAGVGFLLARSVTRPLRALDAAAERIAVGDLATRVPTDRGPPEVRDLAATFNRTAARLDQLVGSQRRFVADAAHQLRTPLTALRLRVENLAPHLPEDQQPQVDATVDEVERLGRLVSGLLLLARHDAASPAGIAVDLASVVAERVDAWAEVAGDQGVELVARLPRELWVEAPDGAVEQILDNLLANALTHAADRGRVEVTARQESRRSATLHVVDDGPGLDAEAREQAFERFWRHGAGAGSGLGLAIVRELARSAGGDAHLDPGPGGRGLDAAVDLLLADRPASAAAPAPVATSTSSTSSTSDPTFTER